jgi:hypothetical protein
MGQVKLLGLLEREMEMEMEKGRGRVERVVVVLKASTCMEPYCLGLNVPLVALIPSPDPLGNEKEKASSAHEFSNRQDNTPGCEEQASEKVPGAPILTNSSVN